MAARNSGVTDNPPLHPATDGPIALKAVLKILFQRWQLTVADASLLLGSVPGRTLYRWRRNAEQANVDRDLLERLSCLLGIYEALTELIPREDARDAWMTRPNDSPVGRGRAPIEQLRESGALITDLYRMRCYLDSERSW